MALQTQTVSIPLGVGVDTKTDPKLVGSQRLLALENARVGDGNLKKRFGYTELGRTTRKAVDNSTSETGTLTTGSALGAFNNETLLFDGSAIYSESIANNEWIEKGNNIAVGLRTDDLQTTDSDLQYSDSIVQNNVLFSVYYDVDNTDYRITVKDLLSGATYIDDISIEASTGTLGYCKATFLSGSFYAFLVDGNTLKHFAVSIGNLTAISSGTNVSTAATERFDLVRISNTQAAIAFNNTSNQTILGIFRSTDGTFSTTTISEDSDYAVALAADSVADTLYLFMSGSGITSTSGSGVICQVFDYSLNAVLSATDVYSAATVRVNRMAPIVMQSGQCEIGLELDSRTISITDAEVDNAADTFDIGAARFFTGQAVTFTTVGTEPTGLTSGTTYYVINTGTANEIELATTQANALIGTAINITSDGSGTFVFTQEGDGYTNQVAWYRITQGGTVSNRSIVARNVGLSSKPYAINDTQFVYAVEHESTFQSTSFLLIYDIANNIETPAVCKMNVYRSKGLLDVSVLPQLFRIDENSFGLTNSRVVRLESEQGEFDFEKGLVLHEFRLDTASRYFNEQIGKNTIIGGGIVKAYDGISATELGFNLFPYSVRATAENAGGSLAAGTYGISAVYRWIDNQGLVHRSAPSIPISVTVSGGSSVVNVEVPYLRITDKSELFARSNIVIEIYMTRLDGTIYYLRTTAVNDVTDGDSYTASFSISTQPAGSEELLYTTGGILENIAPPPSLLVGATKNRLFLVNSENRKEFWYSKAIQPQLGLAFSDVLRDRIEEGVNEITALQAMDDKMCFAEPSRWFFISGDGPNDLGVNNTFTSPQLITNQVGCNNPDSLVFYAQGIAFQSPSKGWWLLSRGLGIEYIGADVEEYKELTVRSANIIEDVNEIRWVTVEGRQIVYDYYRGQWATDTGLPANDAIFNNSRYYLLRNSNGIVWLENNGYLDNGSRITMSVTTAWLKVSAIQGYQRVKEAWILGDFKSDHSLKIQIGYDYQSYYADNLTWAASDVLSLQTFGDDSVFGSDSVFGGVSDGVYQVRIFIPQQKSESIRFKISDISDQNPGESMELSSLDLRVGVKLGGYKTKESKQV